MKKLAVLVGVVAILSWGTSALADFSLTFDGAQDLTYNSANGQYGYNSGSPNITIGPSTASPSGGPLDIVVTSQYASYGVNFSDPTSGIGNLSGGTVAPGNVNIAGNSYTLGGATFGYATPTTNYWLDDAQSGTNTIGNGQTTTGNYVTTPTSNFLGFNKGSYVLNGNTITYNAGALATFSSPLTSLSFDLYRPGKSATTSTVSIELFDTINGTETPVGSASYSLIVSTTGGWLHFNSATTQDAAGAQLDPTDAPFDALLLSSSNRFMLDNLDSPGTSTVPMPPGFLLFLTGLGGFALLKRKNRKS